MFHFRSLRLSIFIAVGLNCPAFSQSVDSIRLDYNPKLTNSESEWLNQHIDRGGFDFKGKNVAFVQLLTGGFYGIGKFTILLHQKHVFIPEISGAFYQLYTLNEEEKVRTGGLDAIFVLGDKKHKGKMKRLKRAGLVSQYNNHYPQIPADAGNDNNPVLSIPNAVFFNELYRYRPDHLSQPFDFVGKKVAIFSGQPDAEKASRISIPTYVQRIQQSLDLYGSAVPDFTYILTEEQKRESGGYDVIIQYRSKMGGSLQGLVERLGREE